MNTAPETLSLVTDVGSDRFAAGGMTYPSLEQFAECQPSISGEWALSSCQRLNERYRRCRIGRIAIKN